MHDYKRQCNIRYQMKTFTNNGQHGGKRKRDRANLLTHGLKEMDNEEGKKKKEKKFTDNGLTII